MTGMRDLRAKLREEGVLIADGAWGTELMKKGARPGGCPELLNLENPAAVRAVAESYREAGADILLTNTFGANRLKMRRQGLEYSPEDINRAGVEISREAAGDGSFVFASMGPTGEFLHPLGNVSREEMVACFREQAEGFIKGGADGVVIETMSAMEEAKCALAALRQVSSVPVAVTFVFQEVKKGFATVMGVTPGRVVEELAREADLLGANCGSGAGEFSRLAEEFKSLTDLSLWMKPNAGAPVLEDGKTVYRESPAETASAALELVSLGVKVVGGCCGTTPEYTRRLRELIRRN